MVRGLARGLGGFSGVLGIVEVLMPTRLLRLLGIPAIGGRTAITRLIGVRELTVLPGLLTASRPVGWLAARIAGDVVDLILLIRARGARHTRRGRVTIATVGVLAVTVADVAALVAARRAAERSDRHPGRTVGVVTVNRSTEELYGFWRDLENLPRVMPHLESVRAEGHRSHWVARGPLGSHVEWDAELVDDRPNELIAWRSVEGSDIRNAGTVRFSPAAGNRGTEVTVEIAYDPPRGPIGSAVAMLTGEEPRQQLSDALRRFKQVMETGEPIVSAATLDGRKILQSSASPPAARPDAASNRVPETVGPRS